MAEGVASHYRLTNEDRVLLTAAQGSFPIERHPFAALGRSLGQSEESVIQRLASLKAAGFLRKIGPVFEPARLGLTSELLGVEVAPSELERAGCEMATWPPVTHCYARDHRVNLWLAAVAAGPEWFELAAARAASLAGVRGVWRLPALRRFKIAVHFDLTHGELATTPAGSHAAASQHNKAADAPTTSRVDLDLLHAAESDLPLCSDPFSVLASSVEAGAEGLVETLRLWLADGRVRRYGALVNHRRLGLTSNSMTAWAVPEVDVNRVGKYLASSPHVSHCYERPAFPGFPYNMYAMIHGTSKADCLAVVTELSAGCGCGDPATLFSHREFKKATPDYADLLTQRGSRDLR